MGKYRKLDMKPDTFSDDDFDLGEDMEEPADAEVLGTDNLNAFGDEEDGDSQFGPLPVSSNFVEGASVPTLQAPPQTEGGATGEQDSLAAQEDALFNGS